MLANIINANDLYRYAWAGEPAKLMQAAFSGNYMGESLQDIVGNNDNTAGKAMSYLMGLVMTPVNLYNVIMGPLPLSLIMAAIKKVVSGIKNVIGNIKDKIKGGVDSFINRNEELSQYVDNNDIIGLWKDADVDDEGNPISGFARAIDVTSKSILTVQIAFNIASSKIKQMIGNISSIKDYIINRKDDLKQYVDDNDIIGLWKDKDEENEEEDDNPIKGFTKAIDLTTKSIATIQIAFSMASSKVKELVHNFTDPLKENFNTTVSYIDTLISKSKTGNIKDVLNTKLTLKNKRFEGLFKFIGNIGYIASLFTTLINKFSKNVVESGKTAVSKVKDFFSNIFGNKSSNNKTVNKKDSGGASGIQVNNKMNKIDSGFVSQLDPRYSNMKLGNSTVEESGCAPAVAAMAANIDMNTAVKYAQKYTTSGGVSSDYFKNIFDRNEITNKELKSSTEIKNSLKQGKPVILLGRDPSNKSKDKSPFGPKGHYILARAMKGNKIVVQDPESRSQANVYDSSIINKSNFAISSLVGAGIRFQIMKQLDKYMLILLLYKDLLLLELLELWVAGKMNLLIILIL